MKQASNRDIKTEYSWMSKGITSSIINQIHTGSKSLIAAFWSDGEYVWALLNETVNSTCFQSFLCITKYFLKLRKIDVFEDSVIGLDNASYHSSSQTKEAMKRLGMNIRFLPPYSPALAPVEQLFKLAKVKIKSSWVNQITNFSSIKGTEKIISAFRKISHKRTENLWHEFLIYLIHLIAK